MSNDITIKHIDNELAELKSDLEIIKSNLEKKQAEKASRLEDSLFSPNLFNHYQNVAQVLSKSGMIPKQYIGKPEDIFVAMAMGYQLGFSVEQSMQDIAVINGRPCLWGDGLLALCINHPDCQGIDEQPIYKGEIVIGYSCTVKRKGHEPHTHTFTMQDAEKAGLLKKGGVWNQYPARMCQMRARSLALRDKFADALRGLRIAEVEQDDAQIIDAEVVSSSESQTHKLKEKLMQSGSEPAAQPKKETVKDNSFPDMIDTIKKLMKEKNFDEERQKKAFEYFKVKSLSALTDDQARMFISQLEKV